MIWFQNPTTKDLNDDQKEHCRNVVRRREYKKCSPRKGINLLDPVKTLDIVLNHRENKLRDKKKIYKYFGGACFRL